MKKILTLLLIVTAAVMSSCEEEQTYAEQKKAERRAISRFISQGCLALDKELGDTILYVAPITEINEQKFFAQDTTTDLSRNEYVKFPSSGVYMQIVRKGTGEKLNLKADTVRLLCRYKEYNISGDSLQTRNDNAYYIGMLDEMTVECQSGTINGSFVQGMMKYNYGSTTVPEGWLIPLRYINIGRQLSADDEIAKVRIIVPHSSGQTNAVSKVYPCFYEITYQRGR
ncbi:MAG: DUF4827 domain-containing protein [Bacteroidaceae bacterium]|nr:DUF4827 domain-containing protein [Bacteroidaceae bacterium]MBO4593686.1 DUF4827 domain-containing protein [Bacteroidaceae bacterium]MBR4783233.1 DUF4827 domain-containing protein [Bacteroidaceae bacterium]